MEIGGKIKERRRNLMEKIKFALIEQILAEQDFSDISNTFSFYNVPQLENADKGSCLIILNSTKAFAQLLEVSGLNNNNHDYTISPVVLDNLKHIMTSNYSNIYVGNIEKLYTTLKSSFTVFSNISMENIYVFEYDSKKLLLIYANNKPLQFKQPTSVVKMKIDKVLLNQGKIAIANNFLPQNEIAEEYFSVFNMPKQISDRYYPMQKNTPQTRNFFDELLLDFKRLKIG